MNAKLLSLATAALLIFSSCTKEETPSDLVGTWKKVLVETRNAQTDWQADDRTCWADDVEEFSENGNWTLYDGTSQCNAGTGMMTGSWELTASNTKVVFTYDGVPGTYESTVVDLDKENLVLTYSSGDLDHTENRITYIKQ